MTGFTPQVLMRYVTDVILFQDFIDRGEKTNFGDNGGEGGGGGGDRITAHEGGFKGFRTFASNPAWPSVFPAEEYSQMSILYAPLGEYAFDGYDIPLGQVSEPTYK